MDAMELADKYVQLRDKKAEIETRHKEELAPYNRAMTLLETMALKMLNDQKADSIATEKGTIYQTTRVSAKVDDWDATLKYIIVNRLWHVLQKRVSKDAVEEYIEETKLSFPGVSMTRSTQANIRRA